MSQVSLCFMQRREARKLLRLSAQFLKFLADRRKRRRIDSTPLKRRKLRQSRQPAADFSRILEHFMLLSQAG